MQRAKRGLGHESGWSKKVAEAGRRVARTNARLQADTSHARDLADRLERAHKRLVVARQRLDKAEEILKKRSAHVASVDNQKRRYEATADNLEKKEKALEERAKRRRAQGNADLAKASTPHQANAGAYASDGADELGEAKTLRAKAHKLEARVQNARIDASLAGGVPGYGHSSPKKRAAQAARLEADAKSRMYTQREHWDKLKKRLSIVKIQRATDEMAMTAAQARKVLLHKVARQRATALERVRSHLRHLRRKETRLRKDMELQGRQHRLFDQKAEAEMRESVQDRRQSTEY